MSPGYTWAEVRYAAQMRQEMWTKIRKEHEMSSGTRWNDYSEKAMEREATAKQRRHMALIRANVLHLVDLKRAGHSPRQTELVIPDDGGHRSWSRMIHRDTLSLIGSPSDYD